MIKEYIYKQLALTFFPIFFGLFFITSIISLVEIASLTSLIQINLKELGLLFLYVVPKILFYSLPISYFISMVISLSRLSNEYELIVITSFGMNPLKVLRVLLPISFLLSLSLLIISVGLIPKAKVLNKQLLIEKKKEANFNIKASEFGQKFGNWVIYIDEKNKNVYKEVKLFQTKPNVDQFIVSKNAVLENKNGGLSFKLNEGKSFYLSENSINQIDFSNMDISDSIASSKTLTYTNFYEYWKEDLRLDKHTDDFIMYILLSIFPLISLFLVIAFGYFNPRYDKNQAVGLAVSSVVFYYILIELISSKIVINTIFVLPLIWIPLTYYVYYKRVKSLY